MNIELNGVVYSKSEIQSGVNKYIAYLEGLSEGLYGASEGEVALLELAENKSIEDVINKLQNLQNVSDIANFDFNASGTSDSNDVELLKSIIAKSAEQQSELQIIDKGASKEFITSGGYKIVTNGNAQDVKFYYPNGSLMTHIHGDPHVDEYNEQGQKTGGWHYADDSTFILPDGTEIVMNSQTWGGNQNIMVNRGIYVKDGDKVAAFGLEFGEGRNNSASDVEEGATSSLRFLNVDASQWDASVADLNISGKRNGVFASINGQWARRATDGNFYDLNSEAWGDYVARQGNELLTNGEAVKVNREQLIAALDGRDVLTYQIIIDLDLGDFETEVVNEFLENKSKFNNRLIQQLGLLNDFGVEKEDLLAVINGGTTAAQANYLNKITDFFFSFDADKEINSSVKDAVLDKYFSFNHRVDREPKSTNPELTDLVHELIDMNISENNAFFDYKNKIFDNSIFSETDIDIEKVRSQKFFLVEMNHRKDFIKDNEALTSALNDLLASKFFDLEQEKIDAAKEILTDNQEKHINLIEQTFVSASEFEHTYGDQFEELLEKILDPKLAQAIHEDDFSILSGGPQRNTSAVISSRYTGSRGRNSSLANIVNDFIKSKEISFSDFVEKAELILSFKDEASGDEQIIATNRQIIQGVVNLKLNSLRSESEGLHAQLDAISGSNSRYDVRRKSDLNRSIRNIDSRIASIISALGV